MIVTIAGSPGAGKREVGRALADRLGFRFLEVPDLRRALAKDHEVPDSELEAVGEHEFWTDHQVDEYLEELAASYENLVISSRFGFHLVPHSFKVRLECDPIVTAHRHVRRGVDRYGDSADEIVASLRKRIDEDRARGSRFYGKDPHDLSHFDLVLDVSSFEHDHVVELLSSALSSVKTLWTPESEHI